MLTIGLCDDSPGVRSVLEAFIRTHAEATKRRFHVHAFASGEQLLAACEPGVIPFDLFLLDHQMKGMTGLETARRLRRLPAYCVCPLVFVTAFDDPDAFLAVHPLLILPKPIDMRAINELLDRVLEAKHSANTG